MSEGFVRVRLANGTQCNLPADHPGVTAEGVVVLDKPTHLANGDPIPEKHVTLAPAPELTVAELRAEIERRNEGRDEDSQISTAGRKADLVEALKADDAASEATGGPSAATEEE
jgi:hypothetical protein